MTSVKLKICGMRNSSNIQDVAALRPDYMGFIFYPDSPRYVGERFNPPALTGIQKVGVFVNATHSEMLRKVEEFKLDYIQLHGNESADDCRLLNAGGVKIIKAFAVDEHFDFRTTVAYEAYCDFFLFDTKGKYFGGNSLSFDWTILQKYDQAKPFFLSGGLSDTNIADVRALRGMNLHGVDVNSGVEVEPALKDVRRIKTITNILNSWL